ncbi:hypothetical protein [Clostridium tertium]|uniref:hypothetical protein n=2 Tax=Clostridiaceae TaxID=31979 RepID=UPI001143D259|nr:hypothetical protein [Clostridium tertium]
MYKPDLIRFPKFNVDITSIFIIVIAILVLFSTQIIKLLNNIIIKIKNRDLIRALVVIICFGLAIVNIFFKSLNIDNNSIYLIIIATTVLIIPDFRDLIYSIKKFKKGDLELEFDNKLSQLLNKAQKVEEKMDENDNEIKAEYSAMNEKLITNFAQAASDPRGAIMVIAAEIESRIRNLAESADITSSKRIPLHRVLEELNKRKIVDYETISLFRDFWTMRNRVVHDLKGINLGQDRLYELAELGIRVLNLLPVRVLNN